MHSLDVNGTQFAYTDRGAGEPVVLVHGSLGDLRSWAPQLESFERHHRVICYSRRHHHPNRCPADGSGYSATLHAEDLAAFMTGLGLGSAHIVGSSYGAYTALVLAARHPNRVRALALAEPPILPLLEHQRDGRARREAFLSEVWQPAGELLARGELERGVRTFVDALFEDGTFDQLPGEVHDLIMDNVCAFTMETSSPDFWTPFSCQDAGQVAAPTLLLSGGKSLPMFEGIVDELERCLPRNERVHLQDCSHDLPGEAPDMFNEIVLEFLARQSP